MAKTSRGGKRGVTSAQTVAQQINAQMNNLYGNANNQYPLGSPIGIDDDTDDTVTNAVNLTQQQVLNGQQGDLTSVAQFQQMTDDEKAQIILDAMDNPMPLFLDDDPTQALLYAIGQDSKPLVMTDAQLDAVKGVEMYRTVNTYYNRTTDVGHTATEILDQIEAGDYTMVSGMGGSAYGRGIYFATSFSGSKSYGRGNSGNDTLMARAKILPNAKIISETSALNGAGAEMAKGTALGKALQKVRSKDGYSLSSVYAMAKGYQIVASTSHPTDNNNDYVVVLDRSAIAMSNTYKNPTFKRKW